MNLEAFAASRAGRLKTADDEIRPLVERAFAEGSWADVVEAAAVLWLETFSKEAPNADGSRSLVRFQKDLTRALEKFNTSLGTAHVELATKFVGTMTVNDATMSGGGSTRTSAEKVWVARSDDDVRETHRSANGQRVGLSESFTVGGAQLRYPGQPVGPIEEWINCRCLVAVTQKGMSMSAKTEALSAEDAEWVRGMRERLATASPEFIETMKAGYENSRLGRALFALATDDPDDTVPLEQMEDPSRTDVEMEQDVEEPVEIPVHGVLAPEGVVTGDGRKFKEGALSTRVMPLPIKYQPADADAHDGSVVVGRMVEAWRHTDGTWRYRGWLTPSTGYQDLVVAGIIEGTISGNSIDLDMMALSAEVEEGVDYLLEKARIAGTTLVAIGAFEEGFVALGWEFDDELEGGEDEEFEEVPTEEFPDEEEGDGIHGLVASAARGASGFMELDGEVLVIQSNDGSTTGVPLSSMSVATRAEVLETFGRAPGLKKDGTAPVCKYCDQTATQYVLHAEGMAYVPACDEHIEQAKSDAEKATPDGTPDPGNIDRIGTYAPGTKDGPGWITNPQDTSRIRRYWVNGEGAAKIRWGMPGDFNRCRSQLGKYIKRPDWLAGTCANMHKEALGVWPGRENARAGIVASAAFQLVDEMVDTLPGAWFRNPNLDGPTPFTVTDDGRVFGHVATWGVCHIGSPRGGCTTAPHSATNYAIYRTGVVHTDEGPIPVGQITMNTGHQDTDARISAAAAMAHYDNTGTAAADVAAGEDAFGIWVAGALRPGLSREQVHTLRAAALSGDWRDWSTGYEMVGVLAVNVPGFPVPRSAMVASAAPEEHSAIVAAGIVLHDPAEKIEPVRYTAEEWQTRVARLARVRELGAPLRAGRLAAIRQNPIKEKVHA